MLETWIICGGCSRLVTTGHASCDVGGSDALVRESSVRGQKPERLAASQGSNGAEVALVKRGDLDRAKPLGESDEGSIGEPEAGVGVALGYLHRRRNRAGPPLDQVRAGSKIGTQRSQRCPSPPGSDEMIDLRNDQRSRHKIVTDIVEPRGDEPMGVVAGIHKGDDDRRVDDDHSLN